MNKVFFNVCLIYKPAFQIRLDFTSDGFDNVSTNHITKDPKFYTTFWGLGKDHILAWLFIM